MTNLEKVKQDITEINDSMELAAYLSGLRSAAMVYCNKNYPDEVIKENGRLIEISLYGMKDFLESEAE